jgi:hypothetical protein
VNNTPPVISGPNIVGDTLFTTNESWSRQPDVVRLPVEGLPDGLSDQLLDDLGRNG